MSRKIVKMDGEFYKEYKECIEKEILKAEKKKLSEIEKIENEVSSIQKSLSNRGSFLKKDVEVFYDDRVRNLKRLLDESIVLEKLPYLSDSEIGSVMAANYKRMEEDLLAVLKDKTEGDALFEKLDSNRDITIGSVNWKRGKGHGVRGSITDGSSPILRHLKTTVSEYLDIQCSKDRIMIKRKDANRKGTFEWMNLETGRITRMEMDFFVRPLKNDIILCPTSTALRVNDCPSAISLKNGLVFQNDSSTELVSVYMIATDDYVFWINERGRIYGPKLNELDPLKETSVETENFEYFLKNSFFKDTELLFDEKKIFVVNTKNFSVKVFSQAKLFHKKEIIIGSRMIHENELALVFRNIQNIDETITIKYFRNESPRKLSEIDYNRFLNLLDTEND